MFYQLTITLFSFLLGAGLGSFVNMAVYRIRKNQNFFGRSYCDFCKKELSPKVLIPIFSFIFSKGKTNCCNKKLNIQYPLIEFIMGIIFTVLANIYLVNFTTNSLLEFIYYGILTVILTLVFIYDLKYYEIPIFPILVGYIIYFTHSFVSFFLFIQTMQSQIISGFYGKYFLQAGMLNIYKSWFLQNEIFNISAAIFTLFFFLFIFFITKKQGLGFGDVYTAPLLSLIAGVSGTGIFLISSFTTGAVFGILLIVFKGKNLKSKVPLGPFLIIGLIIALTTKQFFAIFSLY